MGMQTVSKNNLRFNKNYNKFKFYKKNNIYCSRQKLTNTINTKSINRSIINYSTFSKKDRYAKYKTPFLYIYPLATLILYGRNTMNQFPINLVLYQLSGVILNYFFRNTFLIIVLYMFLIFAIIFNKNIDK